jgi:hypothetical protein
MTSRSDRIHDIAFQRQRPGAPKVASLRYQHFQRFSFLRGIEKQGRVEKRAGGSPKNLKVAFFAIEVRHQRDLKTRKFPLQLDVIHIGINDESRRAVSLVCCARRLVPRHQ